MAAMLESILGGAGRWAFLCGFWGAVATSMLGVWQGVPYLFCDFVGSIRGLDERARRQLVHPRSMFYRLYLGWLALPPLTLLVLERPVGLIVLYTVLGSLFMPFVAGTLLFLNSRRLPLDSRCRNGAWASVALIVCLLLFGLLGGIELVSLLDSGA